MAVVLPKGKSLDQCAELTQRRTQSRAAKDGTPTGRPKKRRKPRAATGGRHTVFDFLNHKLGGRSTVTAEGGAAAPSAATGVEAYRGDGSRKRSLNVKLFQAAERVSQTEREIQKLTESLSRQTGRLVLSSASLQFCLSDKIPSINKGVISKPLIAMGPQLPVSPQMLSSCYLRHRRGGDRQQYIAVKYEH